jgi:Holliday junction resolvase RusA-like endonuclease
MVMGDRPPLEGPVEVTMNVCFPVPESWSKKKKERAIHGIIFPTVKPDNDNLLKVIDALNEIVFRDDKQVVISHVYKTYSERPRMTIEVSQI